MDISICIHINGKLSIFATTSTGSEFRDTVKKTFFLYLTPKEVGALFGYFRERGEKQGTRKVAADQVSALVLMLIFMLAICVNIFISSL